jgi:HEAT repeat protein
VLRRLAAVLFVLACVNASVAAGVAYWYHGTSRLNSPVSGSAAKAKSEHIWLDRLQSQNPRVAEEAEWEVTRLGASALPELRAALQDPTSSAERIKAALRACALLGTTAASALPEITAHLRTADYAAEAAMALSVMGPDAYTPLTDALTSEDAAVRKEALRSLGKLQGRASLDPSFVVPPLLDALADRDPGVRAIATTYLGIIHKDPDAAVPALTEMLKDEDPEVRTAAATALGSFGAAANPALPALRRAQGDKDENVAREAGLALVKLQSR